MSLQKLKRLLGSGNSTIPVLVDACANAHADRYVEAACQRLNLPFFLWSGDAQPAESLQHALLLTRSIDAEAVFFFDRLDFGSCRSDDADLKEMFDDLHKSKAQIVLSTVEKSLPNWLEANTIQIEVGLPGVNELGQMVDQAVETAALRRPFVNGLKAPERSAVIAALWGLPRIQASQRISQAIFDKRVAESKISIRQLLKFYPATTEEVTLSSSFEDLARRTREKQRLLLTGADRKLKAAAIREIADQHRLPTLRFCVGSQSQLSKSGMRQIVDEATEIAESVAPCALWLELDWKGGKPRNLYDALPLFDWIEAKNWGSDILVIGSTGKMESSVMQLTENAFGEVYSLDLPTAAERSVIWEIQLRQRQLEPSSFDLRRLVASTFGYRGKAIGELIVAGLYRAAASKKPLDTEILMQLVKPTRNYNVISADAFAYAQTLAA